ncbi:hypothetical protein ADN00_00475 [Ornatilinea apprima]|uniref:O-antigen ligase-related domain-containing protein n=1 Tax=Ornatilinea apprima TaxID=1134406 RepID=A0A0P6XMH1_9CHLR|nr:O-antigen ligase family protein [Ornatilinea apprima]KPL81046.1 hypothetical protein ADN00_00475 [Ornatilinea apprima]
MTINQTEIQRNPKRLAQRIQEFYRTHMDFVVIFITIAIALILGLSASAIKPIVAVAISIIPALLIGFNFYTQNLQFSPIILLISGGVIPLYVSTGTASVVVDSLLLVVMISGLWILRSIVLEKRIQVEKKPYNIPLFAYMTIVAISLVWGTLFRDPTVITWSSFFKVQLAATTVMIMLPVTFLISSNLIRETWILKAMAIIMIIMGCYGYLYEIRFTHRLIWVFFNRTGLMVSNQGLFTMWVVVICVAWAFFDRGLKPYFKLGLLALAGVWIRYRFLINISWVTGWLPALTALGVLIWMRSKKLFLLLVLAILIVGLIKIDFIKEALAQEQTESGYTRLDAWAASLTLTKEHFLFGTGPGGYAAYYMTYFPDQAMATHNNYLDILAQTGIFGLISFVSFFAVVAFEGFKLCRRLKGKGDFLEALTNAVFAGTIGCIIAMGLGDWMVPFPYTQGIAAFDYIQYSWIFLGTIFAIKWIVDRDSSLSSNLKAGFRAK